MVILKKRRRKRIKKRKTTIKDWRQTKLISPQLKEKTLFKVKESKRRKKRVKMKTLRVMVMLPSRVLLASPPRPRLVLSTSIV